MTEGELVGKPGFRRVANWVRLPETQVAAAIALFLLGRVLSANISKDLDEELYLIIARGWRDGLLPYRDIFDHKPPFLYLLFLVLSFGGQATWLLRLLVAGALTFSALSLARALKAPLALSAIHANLFVALVLAALSFGGGITTNSESFYIPALLLAFSQLLSGRLWLASLAGGLALSIKYTSCLDLGGIAVAYALLHSERKVAIRAAVKFLALASLWAAVQYVAFSIYFESHGIRLLDEILLRNLAHAKDRGASPEDGRIHAFSYALLLTAVAALSGLAARGNFNRKPFAVGLLIWGALSLLQASLTGQFYTHYFLPFAIPVALLVVNFRLPVWVPNVAALALVLLGGAVAVRAGQGSLRFARKQAVMSAYCPSLRAGYYVLDEISAYRVCDITRVDKFVFPDFYLNPHFATLSGSGGVLALAAQIKNGSKPGVIYDPQRTWLPEELSSPSVIRWNVPK